MDDKQITTANKEKKKDLERIPYKHPQLEDYGTIRKVTLGSFIGTGDSGFNSPTPEPTLGPEPFGPP